MLVHYPNFSFFTYFYVLSSSANKKDKCVARKFPPKYSFWIICRNFAWITTDESLLCSIHLTDIFSNLDHYKSYDQDSLPAIIQKNVCQKWHLLSVNHTINAFTAIPIFKNSSEPSDHYNYRRIIIILPLFDKVL